MTLTTVWLIIALVSLTFSALFSGVEIAYISSNRVKVEIDVKRGGFIGRIINLYYKYRDLFISTILVGNNIMLVIYGMGAAEPARSVAQGHLRQRGVHSADADSHIHRYNIDNGRVLSQDNIPHQSQFIVALLRTAHILFLGNTLPHLHIHCMAVEDTHENVRHKERKPLDGNAYGRRASTNISRHQSTSRLPRTKSKTK